MHSIASQNTKNRGKIQLDLRASHTKIKDKFHTLKELFDLKVGKHQKECEV